MTASQGGCPPGYRVTVQEHGKRWAYVLHQDGHWPYVSHARWATPVAAMRAGVADAAVCAAHDAEEE